MKKASRNPQEAFAVFGKLPAEPYPFSIDDTARHQGEAIYQTNCAGCHAMPGRGYTNLRYLLLKAQCLAATKIESVAFEKAA